MAVKILVADTDPTLEVLLHERFKRLIQRRKLAFVFVNDGNAVLELVQRQPDIDMVVSEVGINGVDGLSLLSHLDQVRPDIRTVIVSQHGSLKHMRTAMNKGAFDFLTKPLDFGELEATIIRALRQVLQLKEAHNMIAIHRQQIEEIARASARFVPTEFLKVLGKDSILDVALGDQIQRQMTIMFSDIRNFTSLSEQMSPQENFNFLNSYLKRVSPIIRQYHGFIDKYVGDSIMALFPGEVFGGQTDDAIEAAVAMQQAVQVYNAHRANSGYPPITIGIGLHTGSVMLGTIGEAERMEGTVISDSVNLASRMEGLTRLYGAPVIVSDRTLFGLARRFRHDFRFLDQVQVKGKQKAVYVFEILDRRLGGVEGKLATQGDFEQGWFHYHHGEFEAAAAAFRQVLELNATDKAAQLYMQRTQYYLEYGVPVGWEGIEVLKEK